MTDTTTTTTTATTTTYGADVTEHNLAMDAMSDFVRIGTEVYHRVYEAEAIARLLGTGPVPVQR